METWRQQRFTSLNDKHVASIPKSHGWINICNISQEIYAPHVICRTIEGAFCSIILADCLVIIKRVSGMLGKNVHMSENKVPNWLAKVSSLLLYGHRLTWFWREELTKKKKRARKWPKKSLSTVLWWIYCTINWPPPFLNAKNRYLRMTGVPVKPNKCIKIHYELNNSI